MNIQRKLWDDGDILQSIRDHVEPWVDKGLGAGLFKADNEAEASSTLHLESRRGKDALSLMSQDDTAPGSVGEEANRGRGIYQPTLFEGKTRILQLFMPGQK